MKRLLLSVSVLAMSLGTSLGATTATGFNYDFSSTATGASNCLISCCPTYVGAIYANADGINSATAGVISQGSDKSLQIISNATLTGVQGSGSQQSNGYQQNPLLLDLYRTLGTNCSKLGGGSGYIDMSTNKKVKVTAKASEPMRLRLELGRDFTDATTADSSVFEMNLTTSYQEFTFDYTNRFKSFDSTKVNLVRFKFNVGAPNASTTGFTGTVNIARIQLGSAAITATTTGSVAGLFFNDDSESNQVSVFPNPATENVTVDLSTIPGNSTVRLINTSGTVVSEKTANGSASFALEGLTKGMYFLQISSDTKVVRKKIMIE